MLSFYVYYSINFHFYTKIFKFLKELKFLQKIDSKYKRGGEKNFKDFFIDVYTYMYI